MNRKQIQKVGAWLIFISLAAMVLSVLLRFSGNMSGEEGALPAYSLVGFIIGMSFCFPSMLEVKEGTLSTMRIVVFAILLVFALVYVKTAWNVDSLSDLTIDDSWVYILGLAFGAKVIQRYAEDDEEDTPAGGAGNAGQGGS